jgi:DNA-directed RNA polymerase specialized sigma24 family protein
MARNKAIDRLRLRRFPTEQIEAARYVQDGETSAFELMEQEQEGQRLAVCLEQLEDKQRRLLQLMTRRP